MKNGEKKINSRAWLLKTTDTENIALMDTEKKKWRDILHMLIDITLYLALENLPSRDNKDDESSLHKRNPLKIDEMLSKYDQVLKAHLMKLK